MKNETFFYDQTDLTAYKIFFYENYVKIWLIKLLMQQGECYVGDLFCGTGMNGKKPGSPIVLILEGEKMINAGTLLKKFSCPVINVLFSDSDSENIDTLKKNIEKLEFSKNISINFESKTFSEIMPDLKSRFGDENKCPKFFFLDPFTYSAVKMKDLSYLMSLENTEIMLFLPAFHAYRFSKSDLSKCKKLKGFLGEFTSDNYSDIKSFVDSIKFKIESEIPGVFARPVTLDGGKSKNCLLLLTKNYTGLDAMNNLIWKTSGEGSGINISKQKQKESMKSQQKLFAIEDPQILELERIILTELQTGNKTNKDLIKFAIVLGYRLPDLNKAMNKLRKSGTVKIESLKNARANTNYLTISNLYKAKTVFSL